MTPSYKALFAFCLSIGTASAEIPTLESPVTGRLWMDRNLGAQRQAQTPMDDHAFGDIYRWNSAKAYPGNSRLNQDEWDPALWGEESIHLKPGVLKGKQVVWSDTDWQPENSPCPQGFSIPTKAEWEAEQIRDMADGFAKLRLPMAMYRASEGYPQGFTWADNTPENGSYWSRTTQGGLFFYYLDLGSERAGMNFVGRAYGFSMRCIKDR